MAPQVLTPCASAASRVVALTRLTTRGSPNGEILWVMFTVMGPTGTEARMAPPLTIATTGRCARARGMRRGACGGGAGGTAAHGK